MPVPIRHKVNVEIPGLKQANRYLKEELFRAADRIGKRLQDKVRSRQRKDTGQERARTLYKVYSRKGGFNVFLSVYNTSIQGAVDETGAIPHFPPYRIGSRLYHWVLRKGLADRLGGGQRRAIAAYVRAEARASGATPEEAKQAGRQAAKETSDSFDKRAQGVAFVVARAISRRGLPRPGDPLRKPFETTRNDSVQMINTIFNFATLIAVKRVNNEAK